MLSWRPAFLRSLGSLCARSACQSPVALESPLRCLARSLVCNDPLITCFVPTLFPGTSALPAANAVPPSARNTARQRQVMAF